MLPYRVLHPPFVSLGTLQKLTQLLSRATLARSTALQAVSAGNATFYEVEQILKNLKGSVLETLRFPFHMGSHKSSVASFPHVFLPEFNLQAEEKRREAKDAMRRLPIISSMVTTAREKTDQAKGIVDSAASESKAGSSVVEGVKELTTGIQEVRTDSGAVAVRKRFGGEKHGYG